MYDLVKEWQKKSLLSPVQLARLEKVMPCLPFIAALTQGRLALYLPAGDEDFFLAREINPGGEEISPSSLKSLIADTLERGVGINHWEEAPEGGRGIRSYALRDGDGQIIGALLLFYRLIFPLAEYTHLLHMTETILLCGPKYKPEAYRPPTKQDGVLLADGNGRIVFADEIGRLIYRNLGIQNLLGRNIADEDLTRAIEGEKRTKKTPWEREMYAGERTLRERHLHFTAGPASKGHLLLLADLTEQKRREQEGRVQEALVQRIQELEDELAGLKDSLATRKLLDRAKGILMARLNLSEEESYRRMQRLAMMKRLTMKEIAEKIIAEESTKITR